MRFSPVRATCHIHLTLLHLINIILSAEDYKL
jgi:hypothetical protein